MVHRHGYVLFIRHATQYPWTNLKAMTWLKDPGAKDWLVVFCKAWLNSLKKEPTKLVVAVTSTKIVMIIDGLLPKGPKICSLPRCNQPLNTSWVREPRVHDKGIENYEVKDQDCKAPVKNIGSSLSKFSIWIVTWMSPFSTTPKIPHAFRNQRNCRQESSVSLSGVLVPVHGQ